MIEKEKKYIVYYWTRDAIIQYGQDYSSTGEDVADEFYNALESNLRSIMDYGEKVGEYYTSDEAEKAAYDKSNNQRYFADEVSIWDVDNRCWFN